MADLICPSLSGARRASAARGAFSFQATWSSHLHSAWKCLIWKPANEHESSFSLIFAGTGGPLEAVQLAAVWGIQFSAWTPGFLFWSPTLFKLWRCVTVCYGVVTDTQQPSQQREHYEGRPRLNHAADSIPTHFSPHNIFYYLEFFLLHMWRSTWSRKKWLFSSILIWVVTILL